MRQEIRILRGVEEPKPGLGREMSFCRGSGQFLLAPLCRPTGSYYTGLVWASLGPGLLLAICALLISPGSGIPFQPLKSLQKHLRFSPWGHSLRPLKRPSSYKHQGVNTPRKSNGRWELEDKLEAASSLPGRTAEDALLSLPEVLSAMSCLITCPLARSFLLPLLFQSFLSSLPM